MNFNVKLSFAKRLRFESQKSQVIWDVVLETVAVTNSYSFFYFANESTNAMKMPH